MNKEEWIQEALDQITQFELNIKYLKSCGPDDYQQDKFFILEGYIKCCEKQIKFLEDGIRLIETLYKKLEEEIKFHENV